MSTPSSAIDIGLLGAFLAINLIIGIRAGRKATDFREYAIGNKDFSTATLTATIIATRIGGGFLFYSLAHVYTGGLQFIIVVIAGGALCLVFIGQVVVTRMGEFLEKLSVGEVMGELYSQTVQVATGISGTLGRVGKLAIELKVIGEMLALIWGLQRAEAIAAAAAIVIIYSTFGGVRAVTVTDMFQFVTFLIFIPVLAFIIWHNLDDSEPVINVLVSSSLFNLQETIGWNYQSLSSIGLMLYFLIPNMSPSTFQRIAMARDTKQARQSFVYAGGIRFMIGVLVAWVAILLLADNSDLDSKNLVNYLINRYSYTGLKAFVAIGIISMAMSTADSDLNASSVLIVNDIIKPLSPSFGRSIMAVRWISLGLGVLALSLALREGDILSLMLLAASFYMPIVTVPLLLAIFGFRSSPKSCIMGMLAGLITVMAWRQFLAHTGINSVPPGMLANLVGLMGTHYLLGEEGGWKASDKGRALAD
ncbi:MAG: sodium:solute symporter family protein [Roseivirga sp.]